MPYLIFERVNLRGFGKDAIPEMGRSIRVTEFGSRATAQRVVHPAASHGSFILVCVSVSNLL